MTEYIKYKARRLSPPLNAPPWLNYVPTKFEYYGSMATVEDINKRFPKEQFEVIIITKETGCK